MEEERDDVTSEVDDANEKLNSSGNDLNEKIESIQSSTVTLGSSIDDLTKEIRYVNCNACQSEIWDIERKVKKVKSDFENLNTELSQ